jgi:hypothetical protein
MSTKVAEFKRVKRNGDTLYIKTLPGGAEVHRSKGEFTVYDYDGNYLGFTADQAKAEAMAMRGRPGLITIDGASDLSLWVMWNDAIENGARVLTDDDGWQIIFIRDGIFMRAKEDDSGYDVDLLTDEEMASYYWDDETETFALELAKGKKLRLE